MAPVFDEREASCARLAVEHEANADAAEESGLAVCGAYDAAGGGLHCYPISLDSSVAATIQTGGGVRVFSEQRRDDRQQTHQREQHT